MAYGKKLPDDATLRRHVSDGMTNKEIGDLYGATGESVRQQLAKIGVERPKRPNHGKYLPWRIRADHTGHLLARRLRAWSKKCQGWPMTESDSRLLDEWVEWMNGANRWGLPMAVHYDRSEQEGFWLEPARPGDENYIHLSQSATLPSGSSGLRAL